uniref:UDP-glucuronosyltransferase n=2 Tax=Daphnia pulex TaxID=6669 RepID=A0A023R9H7_DAPPU|nr:UDP-glycosyltransferase 210D1 [Daphnia pulex]
MKLVFVLVVFVTWLAVSEGSWILIVAAHGTKSHQNVYVPLTKELVGRGHHVTLITNYDIGEVAQHDNVNQILLEQLALDTSIFPNMFKALTGTWRDKIEMGVQVARMMFTFPAMVAETTYGDSRIQTLLAKGKFDLVMFSEACGLTCYPFGWHFKAPTIAMSPNVLFPGRAALLGDEEHYSYVPFILSSYTDKMSLNQRLGNYLISKLFNTFVHDWHIDSVHSIFKKMVDPDCPPFIEIEKNFSLVFTNSHPSFSYPRTLPPQVIEVGGLHCRPARPLPDDLEAFVSSSEAGFVVFAIGSAIKMEDMPEEMIQSFIKAFARLPQRVVWQWKGKVRSDLPANVLAVPWLPQQDLLGHKHCRAFLTHGGLNSLQEAVYHGVPVLGFPFGTDQTLNVGRAVKEGYAAKLEWKEITQETLIKSIQEILHDSKYKKSAKRISGMFRDQIQPPLERAVFWTEFVLRHKGTDHLRLGSIDLAPYQRALVDVYFVFSLFFIIPLLLVFFCVRKCCCANKRPAAPPAVRNEQIKKRQ